MSAGEELAVPFIHDPPATKPPPGLQTSHAPESSFSAPRLQPLHPQHFACRPLLRETLFLGFSVPLRSESLLISLMLILCLFCRFQILFYNLNITLPFLSICLARPQVLLENYSQNCASLPDLSPQPQTCL